MSHRHGTFGHVDSVTNAFRCKLPLHMHTMYPPRILLLLYAFIAPLGTYGWVQWGYERDGPGPRSEHSLVMFNDTVYTFGGRGNPEFVTHDPRTFSTERINGTV